MALILYTMIALVGSIQDIRTRTVSNLIHIFIIFIALPNLSTLNILGGILGYITFIIPNFMVRGGIGGADIKFMFASGLLLGVHRIEIAIVVGLILAVVTNKFINLLFNKNENEIPLIPYLAIGCIFSYLI